MFDVFSRATTRTIYCCARRARNRCSRSWSCRACTILASMQHQRLLFVRPGSHHAVAFPLLVERIREKLTTEKLADRVARMLKSLERGGAGRTAGMSGACRIEVAGEELWLLPERAALWPSRRTLLIADPHFVRAGSSRARAPCGDRAAALCTVSLPSSYTLCPTRVVFLGDFFHGQRSRNATTFGVARRGTITAIWNYAWCWAITIAMRRAPPATSASRPPRSRSWMARSCFRIDPTARRASYRPPSIRRSTWTGSRSCSLAVLRVRRGRRGPAGVRRFHRPCSDRPLRLAIRWRRSRFSRCDSALSFVRMGRAAIQGPGVIMAARSPARGHCRCVVGLCRPLLGDSHGLEAGRGSRGRSCEGRPFDTELLSVHLSYNHMKSPYDDTNPHFTADLKLSDCYGVGTPHASRLSSTRRARVERYSEPAGRDRPPRLDSAVTV